MAHGEAARALWQELEAGAAGRTRVLVDEQGALLAGTTTSLGASCAEALRRS
jgi:hypothetical protein